jgi:hypothetical protein
MRPLQSGCQQRLDAEIFAEATAGERLRVCGTDQSGHKSAEPTIQHSGYWMDIREIGSPFEISLPTGI